MKLRAVFACCVFIILGGCASVQQGLLGDTRANVEPFAKETINALVVEDVDLSRSELVYIRDMVDQNTPEIVALQDLLAEVGLFRRELILYSLELVRITDMNTTEDAQVKALAEFIHAALRDNYINILNVPAAEFDAMIETVRLQEEFLAGARAVEPILKIAVDFHSALVTRVEDEALPATIDFVDGRIDEEFGVYLSFANDLADRKDQLMTGLQMLNNARMGDADALHALRAPDLIHSSAHRPPANASEADLGRAEEYLLGELRKVAEIESLVATDERIYLATRAELEREVDEIRAGMRLSRIRVNAWMQAHEALASGVKDPGKWLTAALGIAGTSSAL